MVSLHILLGLFQSHIHLISFHGCIKADYKAENK
jgi:hypothetical protein